MTALDGRDGTAASDVVRDPAPDATSTDAGAMPDVAAEPLRSAVAGLLLALADDEFVIGFTDSEWTGIAPLLEEDVAMSSLAQDELGHARALYQLLAGLLGSDADVLAYDRGPQDFWHARILDGGRGDWATTIARRYLYDTADAVRLEALSASSWEPLGGLARKIRREETYHLLHADAWVRRLAAGGADARGRLETAMEVLAQDAWSVLAPLRHEEELLRSGVLPEPSTVLEARWRERIGPVLAGLGLPRPAAAPASADPRSPHGDAFRRLHAEFTSVRRLEPGASW